MEQPEFIGVQRFFDGIQDYIDFIIGIILGNLVACADTTPIALLKVAGPIG